MKVILKDDIKSLGKMGDVVNVKDGYARNFLIPQNFAAEANTKNIKALDHEKKIIGERAKKLKGQAQDLATKISSLILTIEATAGEEGKLFGSVTTMDIADALKNQGYDIDRKKIMLDEPIKRTGEYGVDVRFFPEVTSRVNIQVVAKNA